MTLSRLGGSFACHFPDHSDIILPFPLLGMEGWNLHGRQVICHQARPLASQHPSPIVKSHSRYLGCRPMAASSLRVRSQMRDGCIWTKLCLSFWGICQKLVIFEKPIFRDFTGISPESVGVDSSAVNLLCDLGRIPSGPAVGWLFLLLPGRQTGQSMRPVKVSGVGHCTWLPAKCF